jgi:hypothetical protein
MSVYAGVVGGSLAGVGKGCKSETVWVVRGLSRRTSPTCVRDFPPCVNKKKRKKKQEGSRGCLPLRHGIGNNNEG